MATTEKRWVDMTFEEFFALPVSLVSVGMTPLWSRNDPTGRVGPDGRWWVAQLREDGTYCRVSL